MDTVPRLGTSRLNAQQVVIYVAAPATVVLAVIGAATYGHVRRRRARRRGPSD